MFIILFRMKKSSANEVLWLQAGFETQFSFKSVWRNQTFCQQKTNYNLKDYPSVVIILTLELGCLKKLSMFICQLVLLRRTIFLKSFSAFCSAHVRRWVLNPLGLYLFKPWPGFAKATIFRRSVDNFTTSFGSKRRNRRFLRSIRRRQERSWKATPPHQVLLLNLRL